jgi:pyruvate,orthophosphate dikinase
MTSHAAHVARGWGKCCIVGAVEITWTSTQEDVRGRRNLQRRRLDYAQRHKGVVYEGDLPMVDA